MGPLGPEPLSRDGLFALVCDEAMKDGVLEPFERELLTRLAGFLKVSPDEARSALAEAKGRFDRGELGTVRPLEPGALYARALRVVMEDGVVDDLEKELLTGVRQLLGIDDEQHRCVMVGLRARMSRTSEPGLADAIAAVEGPSKGTNSQPAGLAGTVDQGLAFLAVAAAVGMIVSGLVVILGPGMLPFETLRRHVDLSRMVQGESASTTLRPGANVNFGIPGVETFGPLVLAGGATYHVGLDVSGCAPRGAGGASDVDVGLRLMVVNADTSQSVEVTPSTRERSELGGRVTSTFFHFAPPVSGPYILICHVTARNAAFDAEVFVTRHPTLSERSTFAVVGGVCLVVLLMVALILRHRAEGR